MPVSLEFNFAGHKAALCGEVLFPGGITFVEDYSVQPKQTIGIECIWNDDGFCLFAVDADALQEQDGKFRAPREALEVLYTAKENETYRHAYLDENQKPRVIVARHIGGVATIYSLRPN